MGLLLDFKHDLVWSSIMPVSYCPRFLLETVEGITVIIIDEPEVVAENILNELAAQFDQIAEPALARVIVNLREVRSMSSSLLGVLLKFSRRVRAAGGRLKLCCIAPDLQIAFRITRFDRLFEIHQEEWTAIDTFAME